MSNINYISSLADDGLLINGTLTGALAIAPLNSGIADIGKMNNGAYDACVRVILKDDTDIVSDGDFLYKIEVSNEEAGTYTDLVADGTWTTASNISGDKGLLVFEFVPPINFPWRYLKFSFGVSGGFTSIDVIGGIAFRLKP